VLVKFQACCYEDHQPQKACVTANCVATPTQQKEATYVASIVVRACIGSQVDDYAGAGQVVPKRDPDTRQGVASAPPVPLPDFSLKSHKGEDFGKERLLGDFALLYLGSLANADHTKSSLDRLLHIVQQQGDLC